MRNLALIKEETRPTHNDAVLPNLNVTSYSRRLDDRVRAYVDMIAYFHGVVVEVPPIGFVRWSRLGPL